MKWGWKYKICLYKPFCQIFPGAGIVETDMRVGQCRGAVRVKKLIHIFYSNIPASLANFIYIFFAGKHRVLKPRKQHKF